MNTSERIPVPGPADLAARRLAAATDSLGHSVRDTAHAVGQLRIPDLVLGFGMIFEGGLFGLPLPFNQIVIMALIALSFARRPTRELGRLQSVVPLLVLGLFYLGMVSALSDPTEFAADWKRRLIRLSLTAFLVMIVASGRIDLRSLLSGLGAGLVTNFVLFYVGIAPDEYGGVLSGYFQDKNVAGMSYAVGGLLLLSLTNRCRRRIGLYLVIGLLVWFTESRTAISGYLSAGLWLVAAPRLPLIGRWGLALVIYLGVLTASEDYSQVGVFSNRTGSDLLRSRIDAASEIRVHQAGFFGDGLGEAYVRFSGQDHTWYFHNSYWSALVEGGWPWLILVLGITVLYGFHPWRRELNSSQLLAQAAIICTLVCAWRLGEVLFTLQWALLLGFALHAFARPVMTDPACGSHRFAVINKSARL